MRDTIQPKFLAVACFEHKMTRTQAWQINREAEKYLLMSMPGPLCGEIAVELGILTPKTRDWLIVQLEKYKYDNKLFDDPLAHPPPVKAVSRMTIRIAAIGGVILLLALVITYVISDGNLGLVSIVAGVLSAIWLAFVNIVPDIISRNIRTHRLPIWLSTIASPLSWVYCVYVVYRWLAADHNANADRRFLLRFSTAMMVVAFCSAVFFLLSLWRQRKTWYMEARLDLTRGLVSKAYMSISNLWAETCVPDHAHLMSHAKDIIQQTARIMVQNPYDKVVQALLFRSGPIGAVSIWYLEPDRTEGRDFTKFNIQIVVAPTAPSDVLITFEQIRESHHPARLIPDRFQQAIIASMRNGELNYDAFAQIPDRKEFASVVGFAFERKQEVASGNAPRFPFFDTSYVDALAAHVSENVKRWLDFSSFAAYPVFTLDSQEDPQGVLIAFKNVRNGITPEDKSALVMTSRLLGFLLRGNNYHRKDAIQSDQSRVE